MRRCLMGLIVVIAGVGTLLAPSASAVDAPTGHLGDTLRVNDPDNKFIADVTVVSMDPSDVPPGFGYGPRWPNVRVYRANVVVHPLQVPSPYYLSTIFSFNGVTLTGDAYLPKNTDAPDALQYSLLNAPQGATVAGGVWWDCYRDLPSSVVLVDRKTGFHLAQWNITEALP
ncbi:hypothetical protein [Mycobacterium sp.]|uniref:hypothetical protein n=1 Tax=Mycobacterium sp. TaxID=1785 RepID=UPI002CBE4B96|nr:hypothetical protein [Mycobacterium sp.]HME49267.1 hypothetical protein [Mycobacterium sp.]